MTTVAIEQAYKFLDARPGAPPHALTLIGASAWSCCFGSRVGDAGYAIRFGAQVEDFRKDQRGWRRKLVEAAQ